MSKFTDIEVSCANPDALDRTIQQLGPAVVIAGSWNGSTCKVRVFGDAGFIKFAITHQGYGKNDQGGSRMSVNVTKSGCVRLDGDDLTALRTACFVRDGHRCSECDRRVSPFAPEWADNRAHMAHIVGRGAGGSDTLENVRTLCRACHSVGEHNPKSVKSKTPQTQDDRFEAWKKAGGLA